MKRLLIILVALSTTLVTLNANEGRMQEKAATQLEYLTIILDLDESQIDEIKLLQVTHLESMEEIHEKYKPILDEMTGQLKELHLREDGNIEESREKASAIRETYAPQLAPLKDELKAEQSSFDLVLASVFDDNQNNKFQELQIFKDKQRMKHQQYRSKFDEAHPGKHKGHLKGKPYMHDGKPGHGPKPHKKNPEPLKQQSPQD